MKIALNKYKFMKEKRVCNATYSDDKKILSLKYQFNSLQNYKRNTTITIVT